MNDQKLHAAVEAAMEKLCREKGYAAPVDVLMEIGFLSEQKYREWRNGRVSYLEAVCTANLSKLATAMHCIRVYAQKHGLKPSYTVYNAWGKKSGNKALRFSKYGDKNVEKWYATHMVDLAQTAKLKQEKAAKKAAASAAAAEETAAPEQEGG